MQTPEALLADKATLSVPEFVIAYGISRATLYKLWADGKGPPVAKIANRTLIPVDGALRWLEEQVR
jgi:predicted DNA-binding transcriptional regulator AlpA